MSCEGHVEHMFERDPDPECQWCGHRESEHSDTGYWASDRGKPRPEPTWAHTKANDPMGLYDDNWEPAR